MSIMKSFRRRAFAAVFAGFFLLLPSFGNAATVDELQAQINALLQQIKTLQQQLEQAQGGGGQSWCHTFNANLRVGDRGDEISYLQQALEKEGFAIADADKARESETTQSNVFGDSTAAAVTGFQQKYKDEILTPNGLQYGTGYVGRATRAKLNQLYGCGPVTVNQPSYSAGPTYIVRGQSYPFQGKISNGLPNAKINFYLQRPDGTLKYGDDPSTDMLAKFQNRYTDANGNFGMDAITQNVTLEGQNGVWTSWVTVGGIASNRVHHTVVGAGAYQPSIVVLSPKAGDQWVVGNTYRISWQPFPSNTDIYVYLNGGGHAEGYSKYIGSPIGTSYIDYAVTPSDLPTAAGYSWSVVVCSGKIVNGGTNCGFSEIGRAHV